MKRTTTTTHRYDADGKLTETVVVETVEDESTPLVQPYVQPYPYTNPLVPWTTTYTGNVCEANTPGLHLYRPDDDDGLAGVPAIA